MIPLAPFVTRIKTQCPVFANRVGGTMQLASALNSKGYDIPVPYAFIVPVGGEDLNVLYSQDEVEQNMRERFTVVVCVDNSVNRGEDGGVASLLANDQVMTIQSQLEAAFLGWQPMPRYEFVRYARDNQLGMDNKRLWHEFEWVVGYTKGPNDPTNNDTELDELDYDDWENGGQYAPEMYNVLHMIYVRFNQRPRPEESGDSLDDNYRRITAHPRATPTGADAGVIAAQKAAADDVIDIKPPILVPSNEQLSSMAPDTVIEPTGPHGFPMEEVEG